MQALLTEKVSGNIKIGKNVLVLRETRVWGGD